MSDGLVAMKLTSPQDRTALGNWVSFQAGGAGGEALRDVASYPPGRGLIWLPARGVLETIDFRRKRTFDSSRQLRRGEKPATAKAEPLDLGVLRDKLAAVETEAKANDPKTLRAEIAKLKADIAKKPPATPDENVIERARFAGYGEGVMEGFDDGIKHALTCMDEAVTRLRNTPRKSGQHTAAPPPHPGAPVSRPEPAAKPQSRQAPPPVASGASGGLSTPHQKVIDAIAWWAKIGKTPTERGFSAAYAKATTLNGDCAFDARRYRVAEQRRSRA